MAELTDWFQKTISHAKEYSFIFPSSEIYEGLNAVYDYGPRGVLLKNNLKDYWWKAMTQLEQNIVGLDAAILMHPNTWEASGHLDAFNDPLIDNKDSKKRYRADALVEDYIVKLENKIDKEVKKAKKRFGDQFDEQKFLRTNSRVLGYQNQMDTVNNRMVQCLKNDDLRTLKELIEELEIADPETGSKNWSDIRQFNLMFDTKFGSSAESSMKVYLRPETAQGIFVNYSNVQKTARMQIPFGIAQIGKAFRNEIVARKFIFRMKEFEQMEMQFFVLPGQELNWFDIWKEKRLKWHLAIGLGNENYRFRDHDNLAHYANAATDIEFRFPFGFKELEGIHSRGDFDLKSHEKYSGKKLRYFDRNSNRSIIPYVIETSIGLDRLFLAIFSHSLKRETLADGSERVVLKLSPFLAPTKAAVLPLVKKDGLPEFAKKILDDIRFDFQVSYDDKDAIGRRYRRQDAIGTPFCITVDHDTLSDNCATIRHRDSMKQERIPIKAIKERIKRGVSMQRALQKL